MPLLSNGASRLLGGGRQWTPASLATLALWVDFADAATLYQDAAGTQPVTADGQSIARVNSKAGSFALTQATATARPTYKTGIVNGRSVARCDGDDWLDNAAWTLDMRYGTYFLVVREETAGNWRGWMAIKPTAAGGTDFNSVSGMVATGASGSNSFGFFHAPLSYFAMAGALTALAIYCVRRTSGAASLYQSGGAAKQSKTFTETGAVSGGGVRIGGRYDGIPIIGDICEALIYSSQLSTADTNRVGAYLAAKWGLTWAAIS